MNFNFIILSEHERQKLLDKIMEKYMATDSVLLGENYSWWDNAIDDEIWNNV